MLALSLWRCPCVEVTRDLVLRMQEVACLTIPLSSLRQTFPFLCCICDSTTSVEWVSSDLSILGLTHTQSWSTPLSRRCILPSRTPQQPLYLHTTSHVPLPSGSFQQSDQCIGSIPSPVFTLKSRQAGGSTLPDDQNIFGPFERSRLFVIWAIPSDRLLVLARHLLINQMPWLYTLLHGRCLTCRITYWTDHHIVSTRFCSVILLVLSISRDSRRARPHSSHVRLPLRAAAPLLQARR